MEQKTRALLINWATIKDRIPTENAYKDPLYIKKLVLLYYGEESLGENTYEEWSKEAETRLASTLNQAGPDLLHEKADSVEILTELFVALASAELSKKDFARAAVEAELQSTCEIAFVAITYVIHSLRLFTPEYLLWHFDEQSENDGSQPYQQVTKCLEVLEELYSPAIKGAFEGDLKPLLNLCQAAFASLSHGSFTVAEIASVAQNRKAANKKNEPNKKTREYAIKLYNDKSWKNPRQASISILNLVRNYGESVGFSFTDDFAAQKRIYDWLLKHKKDSQ